MGKRNYLLLIICLFSAGFLGACADINTYANKASWTDKQNTKKETPTYAPVSAPSVAQSNDFANLPPVKVAILLPLSGPQSATGEAMLQAAQLALFDIGYNKFQLIPRDTGGTTSGAGKAATSAIQDGAQVILGPLFANSVRAVKAVAKPRGVNVIAFSTDWTLADNSTYLMGFMPFSQVDRITKYASDNGYKNFALIAPQDEYGNLVTKRFEEKAHENNVSILNSLRFSAGDPAVINEITKLKNGNFQAVFMPVGGSQTEMISSALSYNKMMPSQIKRIGTGLWDDPRIAKQPNMQGAWFAAPSPRTRTPFENKYMNTYGQKPPRLASLAYDATALTATLAKNGFETNGQPAFNTSAITNPNGFAGTDGVFRFKANGLIERSLAVLELRDGRIIEIDPAASEF
jgi:ABC-type branched-subunit amino acid transport system substrate-binding protein